MAFEGGLGPTDYWNILNRVWPELTDPAEEGALHLQMLKNTTLNTWPNLDAPCTPTPAEVNKLAGLAATQAELDRNAGDLRSVQEKHGIFVGNVEPDGTPVRLPSGWSVVKGVDGEYTVVHNFGHTNYLPFAQSNNGQLARIFNGQANFGIDPGANDFRVQTVFWNSTIPDPDLTDSYFSFIVVTFQ